MPGLVLAVIDGEVVPQRRDVLGLSLTAGAGVSLNTRSGASGRGSLRAAVPSVGGFIHFGVAAFAVADVPVVCLVLVPS